MCKKSLTGRLIKSRSITNMLFTSMSFVSMAACSSDIVQLEHPDESLLWITMNTYAVTLATAAPYNTVQLIPTAYRGNGQVIPDITATFKTSTPNLLVDDSGLVTGVGSVTKGHVVATVTVGNVTRTDTTWISVINTTNPTPLANFSLQMDSVVAAGTTIIANVVASDANGVDRSLIIPARFSISDSSLAKIYRTGEFLAYEAEHTVVVYATTTMFGTTWTDSLQLQIGWHMIALVEVAMLRTITGEKVVKFSPSQIVIGKGGTLVFINGRQGIANTEAIDVVFENPELVAPSDMLGLPTGSGNLPPFKETSESPLGKYQSRSFPVAGTYPFRSELFGASATLIVR